MLPKTGFLQNLTNGQKPVSDPLTPAVQYTVIYSYAFGDTYKDVVASFFLSSRYITFFTYGQERWIENILYMDDSNI